MRFAAYSNSTGTLEKCGGGSGGISDYDSLINIPITNKIGTLEKPLMLGKFESGVYKVKGNYFLSDDTSLTQFIETNPNVIFLIDKENKKYLKLSPTGVMEISVNPDGTYKQAKVSLDGIEDVIKDEVQKYMTNDGLRDDITSIIDNRIEQKIGTITVDEILDLFP